MSRFVALSALPSLVAFWTLVGISIWLFGCCDCAPEACETRDMTKAELRIATALVALRYVRGVES